MEAMDSMAAMEAMKTTVGMVVMEGICRMAVMVVMSEVAGMAAMEVMEGALLMTGTTMMVGAGMEGTIDGEMGSMAKIVVSNYELFDYDYVMFVLSCPKVGLLVSVSKNIQGHGSWFYIKSQDVFRIICL